MIRRYAVVFRLTLAIADAGLAVIVLLTAMFIRFGRVSSWTTAAGRDVPDVYAAIAVFVAIWIANLWAHGLYRSRARLTNWGELLAVVRATAIQIVLVLSLLYFFKLPDVSRLLLLMIFPALAAGAIATRIAMRTLLVLARDHGRNVRFMLVIGTNPGARAFADMIESHPELGIRVIGHLRAGGGERPPALDRPLLGGVNELEQVLHSRIVDEVAICLPISMVDVIEQAASLCEQEGKIIRIPAPPVVLHSARLETLDGLAVYSVSKAPDRVFGLLVKRVIDFVGAGVLLILLAPLAGVISVAIKIDSPGPVLFRQERVGLQGRVFRVFKFRSMSFDAEQHLEHLQRHNEIRGHAFKIAQDPRVTRVGRFLRRTSLDELPQLWNVLLGHMSLVGPRPPLPNEVARYDVWHRRRLSMKPGMTGLWQVGGRRSPVFDDWVQQDLQYIDTWSLWLDLKIIARTVPAVIGGTGR